LADFSGQVSGRIWNNFDHAGKAFESGHVLELRRLLKSMLANCNLTLRGFDDFLFWNLIRRISRRERQANLMISPM